MLDVDDDVKPRFCLVESFSETPKGDPSRNEDRLVLSANFVAVIDGASCSGLFGDVPGGIVAADSVVETLRTLSPEADVDAFVKAATERLAKRLGHIAAQQPRPSAAAVVYSDARREIWRIGDCHFRIDETDYPGGKPIDELAYGFRCAMVRARLQLGLTTVEAETRRGLRDQPFAALLDVQHAFANGDADEPFAYGAIDGRPIPDRFVETYPVGDARQIVLCSDGFLRPHPTLTEGLETLAALRRDDPLLIKRTAGSRPFAPGARFFDDTTYVRFSL
jgi:hypothetical protein